MPQSFRRLIVIQKKRCRMRKHVCGKTFTYEIRYRADGYNVSACGKTIELAKQNFLEKLQTAKPKEKDYFGFDVPRTFHAFSTYYFETFRKEKVKEKTFKKDMLRYRKYMQPYFKEIPLSKIHPGQCRDLLREVDQIGKGKTSDELYSLMNCIFKNAIAHNLMERNPLDVVLHIQHPSESGKALTREEENVLLEAVRGTLYSDGVALCLFCGLRPNELKTAKLRGEFIEAENSKRKHRRTEVKRIPICDKLRALLPADGNFYITTLDNLRRKMKEVLPNHKPYDLRTTFYTRCKEFGVADAAREHYVGHSLGALGNAYTDLSDEYLLEEGKKLNQW